MNQVPCQFNPDTGVWTYERPANALRIDLGEPFATVYEDIKELPHDEPSIETKREPSLDDLAKEMRALKEELSGKGVIDAIAIDVKVP